MTPNEYQQAALRTDGDWEFYANAGGQMTALERAHAIVAGFEERRELTAGPHTQWLVDAIHREIVEHSNAELERRRKVEARLRKAVDALEEIEFGAGQCHSGYGGCDAACKEFARSALRAIGGGDGV